MNSFRSAPAAAFAASVLTIVAVAQSPAGVELRIEPAPLTRARMTVLTVTVHIPEGGLIPAESREGFAGAWLRLQENGVAARELPTFPINFSGYEVGGVAVWKYSPNGPLDTGIEWSTGC